MEKKKKLLRENMVFYSKVSVVVDHESTFM